MRSILIVPAIVLALVAVVQYLVGHNLLSDEQPVSLGESFDLAEHLAVRRLAD